MLRLELELDSVAIITTPSIAHQQRAYTGPCSDRNQLSPLTIKTNFTQLPQSLDKEPVLPSSIVHSDSITQKTDRCSINRSTIHLTK